MKKMLSWQPEISSLASQNSGKGGTYDQAGALPYRRTHRGVEFCLITSTEGHWIFPKETVKPGKTCQKTAIKEALEEAGLQGRLLNRPLGSYEIVTYERTYTLLLFLMEVTGCEDVWEEADFRRRRWATQDEAQRLLCQPLGDCLDAAVTRMKDD